MNLAPSAGSAWPSNIGTEYSESESRRVVDVSFERRSPAQAAVVLRLRYDDHDGVEARGIDLGYEADPKPFPYSQSRFAPSRR